MGYITIIAKFKILDKPAEVEKELMVLAELTRMEKGCVDYIFYRDNDDPSVLLLYENWETGKDLDAHMNTAHFKNCFARIESLYELTVNKLTAMS